MIGPSRGLRAGLLGLVVPVLLVVTPAPAEAHPFGDPQTLAVDVEGDSVVAHWRVGGLDDLTLLGVALGLLPEDRVLLDGAVVPEPEDALVLAAAPEFADYLTEQIRVTGADGSTCPLRLDDASAFAEQGARLVATCRDATTVDITATVLTDLHPAYRLLATGPNGQRAQYDVEHPTHTWVLNDTAAPAPDGDATAATGRSALVQLSAVLGGIGVLAAAGVTLARRRSGGDERVGR